MQAGSDAEALRARAVALGDGGRGDDALELRELLLHDSPKVRRAAASAIGKLAAARPSIGRLVAGSLAVAIPRETHPQVLQYMLKALRLCLDESPVFPKDVLSDVVRNPAWPDYVRKAANETLVAADAALERTRVRQNHWCSRCKRIVDADEVKRSVDLYGKPYCFHCLEERMHEDAVFERDVEAAKRLRTSDGVAVQSQGERRIADWLSAHGIAYRYDERMMVAGAIRIRPDFYLPEFDLYVEYWGMNTPEYVANKQQKLVLYQREKKKLISLSYRDADRLEELLAEKLALHIPGLRKD